jgi:hypothetical protein
MDFSFVGTYEAKHATQSNQCRQPRKPDFPAYHFTDARREPPPRETTNHPTYCHFGLHKFKVSPIWNATPKPDLPLLLRFIESTNYRL